MKILRLTTLFITLLSSMFVLSVSSDTYTKTTVNDKSFDKYKRAFEREYFKYTRKDIDVSKISISFVEEPYTYCSRSCSVKAVGICLNMGRSDAFIIISREYYHKANKSQREALLFHELSHCALDMEHREVEYDGKRISLMAPSMFKDKKLYGKHREAFLLELFTKDVKGIVDAFQK